MKNEKDREIVRSLLAIADTLMENGYEDIFVFTLTKTRMAD
jgi:hypothetical protein